MQFNHVKQNFDENNQSVNGISNLNYSEEIKKPDDHTIELHDIEMQRIEERVDERITDRIANHYELRLMQKSPEANKRFEYPTTVIAPEGAFQWNEEIAQWTCRVSSENFNATYQELSFLLQRAIEIMNPKGESAYSHLTLKQLNALDQALRIHHGDTIIGYTICEEIYLRQINFFVWLFCQRCSEYDYPPLPDAYSKRLLTFIQRPLVLDIAASLRVAAQSYLLFTYFTFTYFHYTPESQDDDIQFFGNNTPWFLLTICSVIVASLLLLRSGCVDKLRVLSAITHLRWIEQAIISMISNLTNYGPIFASTTVIEDCFLPLIIFAGVTGYYRRIGAVINIAEWTTLQFLLRSFFLSLSVGSFCALGFRGFINDVLFLYDDDFTSASQAAYIQALGAARYCGFTMMLGPSLFRYPAVSFTTQYWCRTASNVMAGIGVALLDNYALYLLISDTIFTLNGSLYFSPEKPVAPTFFCSLQAFSFIAVFLVTFPTTPDLPQYSLEKNPINPTLITKSLRFFSQINTGCLSRKDSEGSREFSATEVRAQSVTEISAHISRGFSISYFNSRTDAHEVKPPIENPMNELNTTFSEETKSAVVERRYAV